jgi:hypothetical protein
VAQGGIGGHFARCLDAERPRVGRHSDDAGGTRGGERSRGAGRAYSRRSSSR